MTVLTVDRHRRATAVPCRSCHRTARVSLVHHPSGDVLVCRSCGGVRRPALHLVR